MARGWINSSLLPSSFWIYAVKRAVTVSTYLPITSRGIVTTLFELVHHVKPDIRTLIPLFSIAYIDKPTDNTTIRESFHSQSLRVIVIGRSSTSNCVKFYHPPSKQQALVSANYRLDHIIPAGPVFNLKYDGGLFFNMYHNEADTHRMCTHTLYAIVYAKIHYTLHVHVATKVIRLPQPGTDIYILQHLQTKNILNMPDN